MLCYLNSSNLLVNEGLVGAQSNIGVVEALIPITMEVFRMPSFVEIHLLKHSNDVVGGLQTRVFAVPGRSWRRWFQRRAFWTPLI